MSKSLVLSLSNKNYTNNKDILIAGEWVLEKHDKDLDNLNYEIFYSKSELKEKNGINLFDTKEQLILRTCRVIDGKIKEKSRCY